MYKALEVEYIISRKMLIVTKNVAERKNVRIIRIILDFSGVIVDSKRAVLFQ